MTAKLRKLIVIWQRTFLFKAI